MSTHVVATCDGLTMSLCVNGDLVRTADLPGAIEVNLTAPRPAPTEARQSAGGGEHDE